MFKQSGAICWRLLVSPKEKPLAYRSFQSDPGRVRGYSIEYALIAALIAIAAIAAFTLVGTNLSTTFSTIAAKL